VTKRKKKVMTTSNKKKKKRKRKRKLSKLLLPNLKESTRTNQSGWEKLKTSNLKNTPLSTNPWPMIGKTILLSNNSPSKVPSNSDLFFSVQKELHLISLKPRKRRTTSNFTSEEFSSWTIVKIWSQTISLSSRVLLILKISHLISQESSSNKIKSSKLSRKTLPKNVWNFSLKSKRTLKTIKNSTNNSPKTLNLVSTKMVQTEPKLLVSSDISLLPLVTKWAPSKTTSVEWKKDKKTSFSLLVNPKLKSKTLHSLKSSRKKVMKFSIWLILLMNMLSNNLKNSMVKNLRTVPKKVSI